MSQPLRRSRRLHAAHSSPLLELPDEVVPLILSHLPAVSLVRGANGVKQLRIFIDDAARLRASCLSPELMPPLIDGEQFYQALVMADRVGLVSTRWTYKHAQRSTLLRHLATGATVALSHESVGWLRYQTRKDAEERICWSSGQWNPQEFSRDEQRTRDDDEPWKPLIHLLRCCAIGTQGRQWTFRAGSSHTQTIEFCNEYFNHGKDAVHVLDAEGGSLRRESARYNAGAFGSQRGERLGEPEPAANASVSGSATFVRTLVSGAASAAASAMTSAGP